MTRLHAIEIGHGPTRLVFLHGVFGQGKNFGNVAKLLADQATSVLLDLPNHGRSPWTDRFDLDLFADLVAGELRARDTQAEPVTLIGHSMGGKVAMRLALRHPGLLNRLVVADMSPVARGDDGEFQHLVDSLLRIDLDRITTRKQADEALSADVHDAAVRAFLLQNLHRTPTGDGWRWLANLGLLQASIDKLVGWPPISGRWHGPVLWLRGANSLHVQPADEPIMRSYFPAVQLITIPDAGHWIHADQPQAVASAIAEFISRG
ncbi:alpha/beta fold hydrolase [Brooklawnia sp.]|uniref:alpha/beta fold hydrolase n=1 Tax=Brooklawnia sp. TaxID=2699740 RepID=UPI00311EA86C